MPLQNSASTPKAVDTREKVYIDEESILILIRLYERLREIQKILSSSSSPDPLLVEELADIERQLRLFNHPKAKGITKKRKNKKRQTTTSRRHRRKN